MIGEAKFIYKEKDIIALIRRDLVSKFGQRELSIYDLSVPDIYKPGAAFTFIPPEPIITVTSVAEQLENMHYPSKPAIPTRSVFYSIAKDFGSNLIGVYNEETASLDINGGPLRPCNDPSIDPSVDFGRVFFPTISPVYTVGLEVPLPFSMNLGDVVKININDEPIFMEISQDMIDNNVLDPLYLDARYRYHKVAIFWSDTYAPEVFFCNMNCPLQDSTITRYVKPPQEPIVNVTFPQAGEDIEVKPSRIQLEVDLKLGK